MHIDWWTLALQAFNFLLLVWLLQRFLYKPVLRIIAARREQAEAAFSKAAAAEAKAEETRASLERDRAALAAEHDTLAKQIRAELKQEGEQLIADAKREADKTAAAVRQRLADERAAAAKALQGEAVELAVEIAGRLLRSTEPATQNGIFLDRIDSYLSGLDAPERQALREQLADGAALEVVSSAALDAATQEAWRSRLRKRLGEQAEIAFTADDKLIAGAELHFPNAILRFTWRDALDRFEKELTTHDDAR